VVVKNQQKEPAFHKEIFERMVNKRAPHLFMRRPLLLKAIASY
jgi:hypothetical protein